jgi:hypothetical protein
VARKRRVIPADRRGDSGEAVGATAVMGSV